jgi:hypothetical protein
LSWTRAEDRGTLRDQATRLKRSSAAGVARAGIALK